MKSLSKNEKGITLIVLVIIIVMVILLGLLIGNAFSKKQPTDQEVGAQNAEENKEEYVQKLSDGSKLNVSAELNKDKKLNNLAITNIQLKEKGGITTLLADIENKGNTKVEEKNVQIEILDKAGKTITTLVSPIDSIEPGEKVKLNTSVTGDLSNAYDFRIK